MQEDAGPRFVGLAVAGVEIVVGGAAFDRAPGGNRRRHPATADHGPPAQRAFQRATVGRTREAGGERRREALFARFLVGAGGRDPPPPALAFGCGLERLEVGLIGGAAREGEPATAGQGRHRFAWYRAFRKAHREQHLDVGFGPGDDFVERAEVRAARAARAAVGAGGDRQVDRPHRLRLGGARPVDHHAAAERERQRTGGAERNKFLNRSLDARDRRGSPHA